MKDNHPKSIIRDCIDDWNFKNCFKGWSKKDLQDLYWNKYPEIFFRDSPPIHGAVIQMWDLFKWGKKNIKFVCVSSQRIPGTQYSLYWLGDHGLEFGEIHFIRGSDKWKVDIDWLVDDSPINYESWVKGRGDDSKFILMDNPYNKDISPLYRIKELKEIKDIIK
jgi:5'(3')-deoxyribonucleotidase